MASKKGPADDAVLFPPTATSNNGAPKNQSEVDPLLMEISPLHKKGADSVE